MRVSYVSSFFRIYCAPFKALSFSKVLHVLKLDISQMLIRTSHLSVSTYFASCCNFFKMLSVSFAKYVPFTQSSSNFSLLFRMVVKHNKGKAIEGLLEQLKRCPIDDLSELQQLQIITETCLVVRTEIEKMRYDEASKTCQYLNLNNLAHQSDCGPISHIV